MYFRLPKPWITVTYHGAAKLKTSIDDLANRQGLMHFSSWPPSTTQPSLTATPCCRTDPLSAPQIQLLICTYQKSDSSSYQDRSLSKVLVGNSRETSSRKPSLGRIRHIRNLNLKDARNSKNACHCLDASYSSAQGTTVTAATSNIKDDSNIMRAHKSSARIYRPSFRENKPKSLVFNHRKRAFWTCFRENFVYKFGYRYASISRNESNISARIYRPAFS